ncbi:PAS domain S-box protein [bacterium]|nr:PAS domain S-box protein [bacterium]
MFRALVAGLPNGVCIHDHGRIVFSNEAHWRMLGFDSEEEIIGTDGFGFIARQDRALVRDRIERRLQGEAVPTRYEIQSRRCDGSTFESEVVASTVVFGGQRLMLVVLQDVSARKRTEADERERSRRALTDSEEMHRALFAASPDAIVAMDTDARVFDLSEQAVKLFGLANVEDAIGRNGFDFVAPEDQERARAELAKTLRGVPPRLNTYTFLRADGSRFIGESSGAVICDPSGAPRAFVTAARDVTERKRVEERLQLLSTAVAQSRDGIGVADTNGTLIFVNDAFAKMHDYRADELIGQHLSVLHLPEHMPRANAALQHVHEHGEFRGEIWNARRDGASFPVDINVSLLRDNDGRAFAILGIMTDVTEKKRTLQESIRVQKADALGLLAGGVAHDFNNLLTGIMTNVAAIGRDGRPHEDDPFDDIMQGVLRARDLTQQLLTFSRGGAPVRRSASIAELLREIVGFVQSGSNTSCDYAIAEDLWPASIDGVQISQVVQNLIINANQAMPGGGQISISACNCELGDGEHFALPAGRYVAITIADTGTGISPEALPRVFDPYFTTKHTGNGLGLAVTKSIVERHGGHIQIASELDQGTTIEVLLPASDAPSDCAGAERTPVPEGRGRVLVMDDEPTIRNGLRRLLPTLGYTVACAADGAQALEQYQAALRDGHPFDVVVLDLTVAGGMGGKECIRRLREADPDVKAIVASGYSNDRIMEDPEAYGFGGIMRKPFSPDELAAALHAILHDPESSS